MAAFTLQTSGSFGLICLTLTVCRHPSRRIVNPSILWKRLLLLKKQNPNITELLETQLNIHGAWYGKSGPDMVGRGLAGAWYGGCNMVWNVLTLVALLTTLLGESLRSFLHIKLGKEKAKDPCSSSRLPVPNQTLVLYIVLIAGLPRARSGRGTEPHTHRMWSTFFRLVVTWLTERTYVCVCRLYG